MTAPAAAPREAARSWPPGREPLRYALVGGLRSPLALLLLTAIRVYQLTVSPLLGPVCRFYPSCSHYGYEAIARHGAMYGSYLTVRRLLRCHPWNPGGVDLVPPERERPRWPLRLSGDLTGRTITSVAASPVSSPPDRPQPPQGA